MNIRVLFLALICISTALFLFWYRVNRLGADPLPAQDVHLWEVEARVSIKNPPSRVKLSIGIPPTQSGPKIIEESFRSDSLAAGLIERTGTRSVYWTGEPKNKQLLRIAYVAVIERGVSDIPVPAKLKAFEKIEQLLTEKEQGKARELIRRAKRESKTEREQVERILRCVRQKACPSGDFLGRHRISSKQIHRALAAILQSAGSPSHVARGFLANKPENSAHFQYWVRTKIGKTWFDTNATNNKDFSAEKMIFWGYVAKEPIVDNETEGAQLEYSLVPIEDYDLDTRIDENEYQSLAWRMLSLRNVPISVQVSYRLMLLIPIGALMITIYRSIFGFPTFGTFLPVLIALAFRDTGLGWGLVLLTLIVSLGLLVRSLLSNLRLLLVPRLAASLSIVILLILVISRTAHHFAFTQGLTVTLFPIVIVTMLIERMSISWDEVGARKTIVLFSSSMLCAVLCYAAMMPPIVHYWVFTFPELVLIVLAFTLLCGRYTGYRLAELYRFRTFAKPATSNNERSS